MVGARRVRERGLEKLDVTKLVTKPLLAPFKPRGLLRIVGRRGRVNHEPFLNFARDRGVEQLRPAAARGQRREGDKPTMLIRVRGGDTRWIAVRLTLKLISVNANGLPTAAIVDRFTTRSTDGRGCLRLDLKSATATLSFKVTIRHQSRC